MTETINAVVDYKKQNDVHHITFNASNRQAVDAFFKLMTEIYEHINPHQTAHFVANVYPAGKTLPLRYLFDVGRRWQASTSVHPDARMAIIYYPDALATMTSLFFRTMGWGHLRVHLVDGSKPDAEQVALDWALAD